MVVEDKPLITAQEEDRVYDAVKNLALGMFDSHGLTRQTAEHHLKLAIKYAIEMHRLYRKNKGFYEGDGSRISKEESLSPLLAPGKSDTDRGTAIGEYIVFVETLCRKCEVTAGLLEWIKLFGDVFVEFLYDISFLYRQGFDKLRDAFCDLNEKIRIVVCNNSISNNDEQELRSLCAEFYAHAMMQSQMFYSVELRMLTLHETGNVVVPLKDACKWKSKEEKAARNRKRPIPVKKVTQKTQFEEAKRLAEIEYQEHGGMSDTEICKKVWDTKGRKRGYKDYKALLSKFNREKSKGGWPEDCRKKLILL